MNQELPTEYIIQKFCQFAGYPKYKKGSNVYNGGCPNCHEGKSWNRKSRLNYIIEKNIIHCFNCNKTWSPINWIIENSGLSYQEILKEAKDYNFTPIEQNNAVIIRPESESLPVDSINLFDKQQTDYFSKSHVVIDALKYIKDRRLNTAINRPRALYISLKDFIHKNRLIIPYYDYTGKIIWYQSRAIYKKDEKDRPKYMSKLNSDKSIFGIDKINEQFDYLFIFEGPIDSMFVKNGIAMGGISMTELQETQLKRYQLYKKIWILDNQINDNKDVKKVVIKLFENGETVFLWPDKFKGIKDINELCVKVRKDNINPDFFIKNSYEGSIGLGKLN